MTILSHSKGYVHVHASVPGPVSTQFNAAEANEAIEGNGSCTLEMLCTLLTLQSNLHAHTAIQNKGKDCVRTQHELTQQISDTLENKTCVPRCVCEKRNS